MLRLFLALVVLFLSVNTAYADHMLRHDLGRVQIFGGMMFTPRNILKYNDFENRADEVVGGEQMSPYVGIVVGLGGKWSAGLEYAANTSDNYMPMISDQALVRVNQIIAPEGLQLPSGSMHFDGTVHNTHVTINYHPDHNWTIFAGDNYISTNVTFDTGLKGTPLDKVRLSSNNHRLVVVVRYGRLVGHKTVAHAVVAGGNGFFRAGAGISVILDKHVNWEFGYHYVHAKNVLSSELDLLGMKSPTNLDTQSSSFYTGFSFLF